MTIYFEESEKIFIGRINILGNYITQEKIIRNKLLIDEGDPFNDILLTKSINSIKGTGIFSEVKKETGVLLFKAWQLLSSHKWNFVLFPKTL